MKKSIYLFFTLNILITALFVCEQLHAKSNSNTQSLISYSGEAELGMVYESRLNIDEIDQITQQGDNAKSYKLKLKTKIKLTDKLAVKGFYQLSAKDYLTADNYDQSLNHFNIDAKYAFKFLDAGASISRIQVTLNQQDFLKLSQQTIFLAKTINQTYYFKLANNKQKKSFDTLLDRNSNAEGYSLDSFIFYNSAHSFINFGFSESSETAQDSLFDFEQNQFNIKYSNRFDAFSKKQQLQFAWKRICRDYMNEQTQYLETLRRDTKQSVALIWTLHFNKTFSLTGQLERSYSHSNVEDYNYSKNKAGLTLLAHF